MLLASASDDRTLKLWEPSSGRCHRTLEGHTNFVFCCAFNPAGNMLVCSSFPDLRQSKRVCIQKGMVNIELRTYCKAHRLLHPASCPAAQSRRQPHPFW